MENAYSIVAKRRKKRENYIQDYTKFPKYFLGDSIEEAESLFKTFKDYLNKLSNTYHFSTGIDREEFFGAGIIALGKAKKDYRSYKNSKFIPYAKFLIIDAMNECIRHNKVVIKIPSYINKTNKIINRIKKSLQTEKDWYNEIFNYDIDNINIHKNVKNKIRKDKELIEKAAKRAGLTTKKLVERSEFLPCIVSSEYLYTDNDIHFSNEQHENLLTKLLIDKLMITLNKEEKTICKFLMGSLNKSEISMKLKKSDTWVNSRIKDIKNKLLKIYR